MESRHRLYSSNHNRRKRRRSNNSNDAYEWDDEEYVMKQRRGDGVSLWKAANAVKKRLFRNNDRVNRRSNKRRHRYMDDDVLNKYEDYEMDMSEHLYEDEEYWMERSNREANSDKSYSSDELDNHYKDESRSRHDHDKRDYSDIRDEGQRVRSKYVASNDDYVENMYWAQKEVSSWFVDDEDEFDDYDVNERGNSKRRSMRRRQSSFLENMLNNVRQADDDQRRKAAEWDRAYSYDIDRSRFSQQTAPNFIDAEIENPKQEEYIHNDERQNTRKRRRTRRSKQIMEENRRKKLLEEQREREELDRVPPKGMFAWGPKGEIKIDIRLKAAQDALVEIQDAKDYLLTREKIMNEAKDKRDLAQENASFQRKRIYKRRDYISATEGAQLRSDLRRLDVEFAEASRFYRETDDAVREAAVMLQNLQSKYRVLLRLHEAEKDVSNNSTEHESSNTNREKEEIDNPENLNSQQDEVK